ncbi:MAG: hypothetical protein AAF978_01425 [Cyanobacteria bacterium P01_E01_bin.48]
MHSSNMPLELDHLFVCTEVGAPEVDCLIELGFLEGSPNTHPGQGTANRRIFFRNAKLEFLWICNEVEARSAEIARTRLWERGRYGQTGYAPFGICVRWRSPEDAISQSLPFAIWDFHPPYLPPTLSIDVASQTLPTEPMIFATPFSRRPDTLSGDRAQPLEHDNGCHEITRLRISIPQDAPLSDAALALQEIDEIDIVRASKFWVEVECDRGRQNQTYVGEPDALLRICG